MSFQQAYHMSPRGGGSPAGNDAQQQDDAFDPFGNGGVQFSAPQHHHLEGHRPNSRRSMGSFSSNGSVASNGSASSRRQQRHREQQRQRQLSQSLSQGEHNGGGGGAGGPGGGSGPPRRLLFRSSPDRTHASVGSIRRRREHTRMLAQVASGDDAPYLPNGSPLPSPELGGGGMRKGRPGRRQPAAPPGRQSSFHSSNASVASSNASGGGGGRSPSVEDQQMREWAGSEVSAGANTIDSFTGMTISHRTKKKKREQKMRKKQAKQMAEEAAAVSRASGRELVQPYQDERDRDRDHDRDGDRDGAGADSPQSFGIGRPPSPAAAASGGEFQARRGQVQMLAASSPVQHAQRQRHRRETNESAAFDAQWDDVNADAFSSVSSAAPSAAFARSDAGFSYFPQHQQQQQSATTPRQQSQPRVVVRPPRASPRGSNGVANDGGGDGNGNGAAYASSLGAAYASSLVGQSRDIRKSPGGRSSSGANANANTGAGATPSSFSSNKSLGGGAASSRARNRGADARSVVSDGILSGSSGGAGGAGYVPIGMGKSLLREAAARAAAADDDDAFRGSRNGASGGRASSAVGTVTRTPRKLVDVRRRQRGQAGGGRSSPTPPLDPTSSSSRQQQQQQQRQSAFERDDFPDFSNGNERHRSSTGRGEDDQRRSSSSSNRQRRGGGSKPKSRDDAPDRQNNQFDAFGLVDSKELDSEIDRALLELKTAYPDMPLPIPPSHSFDDGEAKRNDGGGGDGYGGGGNPLHPRVTASVVAAGAGGGKSLSSRTELVQFESDVDYGDSSERTSSVRGSSPSSGGATGATGEAMGPLHGFHVSTSSPSGGGGGGGGPFGSGDGDVFCDSSSITSSNHSGAGGAGGGGPHGGNGIGGQHQQQQGRTNVFKEMAGLTASRRPSSQRGQNVVQHQRHHRQHDRDDAKGGGGSGGRTAQGNHNKPAFGRIGVAEESRGDHVGAAPARTPTTNGVNTKGDDGGGRWSPRPSSGDAPHQRQHHGLDREPHQRDKEASKDPHRDQDSRHHFFPNSHPRTHRSSSHASPSPSARDGSTPPPAGSGGKVASVRQKWPPDGRRQREEDEFSPAATNGSHRSQGGQQNRKQPQVFFPPSPEMGQQTRHRSDDFEGGLEPENSPVAPAGATTNGSGAVSNQPKKTSTADTWHQRLRQNSSALSQRRVGEPHAAGEAEDVYARSDTGVSDAAASDVAIASAKEMKTGGASKDDKTGRKTASKNKRTIVVDREPSSTPDSKWASWRQQQSRKHGEQSHSADDGHNEMRGQDTTMTESEDSRSEIIATSLNSNGYSSASPRFSSNRYSSQHLPKVATASNRRAYARSEIVGGSAVNKPSPLVRRVTDQLRASPRESKQPPWAKRRGNLDEGGMDIDEHDEDSQPGAIRMHPQSSERRSAPQSKPEPPQNQPHRWDSQHNAREAPSREDNQLPSDAESEAIAPQQKWNSSPRAGSERVQPQGRPSPPPPPNSLSQDSPNSGTIPVITKKSKQFALPQKSPRELGSSPLYARVKLKSSGGGISELLQKDVSPTYSSSHHETTNGEPSNGDDSHVEKAPLEPRSSESAAMDRRSRHPLHNGSSPVEDHRSSEIGNPSHTTHRGGRYAPQQKSRTSPLHSDTARQGYVGEINTDDANHDATESNDVTPSTEVRRPPPSPRLPDEEGHQQPKSQQHETKPRDVSQLIRNRIAMNRASSFNNGHTNSDVKPSPSPRSSPKGTPKHQQQHLGKEQDNGGGNYSSIRTRLKKVNTNDGNDSQNRPAQPLASPKDSPATPSAEGHHVRTREAQSRSLPIRTHVDHPASSLTERHPHSEGHDYVEDDDNTDFDSVQVAIEEKAATKDSLSMTRQRLQDEIEYQERQLNRENRYSESSPTENEQQDDARQKLSDHLCSRGPQAEKEDVQLSAPSRTRREEISVSHAVSPPSFSPNAAAMAAAAASLRKPSAKRDNGSDLDNMVDDPEVVVRGEKPPASPFSPNVAAAAAAAAALKKRSATSPQSVVNARAEASPMDDSREISRDRSYGNESNGSASDAHSAVTAHLLMKMKQQRHDKKDGKKQQSGNESQTIRDGGVPTTISSSLKQKFSSGDAVDMTSRSGGSCEATATNATPNDDPKYAKYLKMLKVGMPVPVVQHAMTRDGIDPSVMDDNGNIMVASQSEASVVTPDLPRSPPSTGLPLKEDPKFQKYFKMLKMGLPIDPVKHAMERDGLDPSVMDGDHNAPAPVTDGANEGSSPGFGAESGSSAQSGAKPTQPSVASLMARRGAAAIAKKPKDTVRRMRLHWDTVRHVRSDSVWAKVNKDPDVEEIDIDEKEFANLFQAEIVPLKNGAKKGDDGNSAKQDKGAVKVIDPKRANNGGIILARVKLTFEELAQAIDQLDETAMDTQQLQGLLEYLPSEEERKMLHSYLGGKGGDSSPHNDKISALCECEKFMISMMNVKHAKNKIRCLLFKQQFATCIDELRGDARTVEKACDELSNSVRLQKLLGIVLNIGNRLNTAGVGSHKRKASAFTLDSLLKLNQAKAFDKKTTFLHYVVLVVRRNNELLIRFADDLPTVRKAEKIYFDQCLSELDEVENQLENVRKLALDEYRSNHMHADPKTKKKTPGGGFSQSQSGESLSLEEEVEALRSSRVGSFTLEAIKKVSSLRDKVESTQTKFSGLLDYFGYDDGTKMQPHELFQIIVAFCKNFNKANEEVISNEKAKLREERKQKANQARASETVKAKPQVKISSMQPNMGDLLKEMKNGSKATHTRKSPVASKHVRSRSRSRSPVKSADGCLPIENVTEDSTATVNSPSRISLKKSPTANIQTTISPKRSPAPPQMISPR